MPRDAIPVSRRYPVSRSLLSERNSLGKSTNAVLSDSYTSLPTGSGYNSVGGGASSGAAAACAAGGGWLTTGRSLFCGRGGAGWGAWLGGGGGRAGGIGTFFATRHTPRLA